MKRAAASALVALFLFIPAAVLAAGTYRYSHGDVVEFGSDVNIPADQEVHGDVVVFGGDLSIHGKVDGSAVAFGGDLHIYPEGSVGKDTVSFGGQIINESTSTPPKKHETEVPPPPPMTPMPEMTMPPESETPEMPRALQSSFHQAALRASILIPDLLLTLLAFFLFPLRTRNVEEHLSAQPLLTIVLGVLAPFMLIFVVIVLACLVITIPLIPVAIIAYIIAYFIGKAAVAAALGRRLLAIAKETEPQPLAVVGIGLAVILIFTGFTPTWFGVIMFGIIGAVATGAALLSFMRTRPGLLGTPAATPVQPLPSFTPPAGPAASGPPAIPQ